MGDIYPNHDNIYLLTGVVLQIRGVIEIIALAFHPTCATRKEYNLDIVDFWTCHFDWSDLYFCSKSWRFPYFRNMLGAKVLGKAGYPQYQPS